MFLSGYQTRVLARLMTHLTEEYSSREVRCQVGGDILELLEADYLASYVWDPGQKRFVDRVYLNMSDHNLGAYERYFQFRDPITPLLQQRRKATLVCQIMPQEQLVQTEFFNDFLQRDGLYYGINLYAYDRNLNIGDLRVWRSKQRGNFDQDAVELLELIKPAFTQALKRSAKPQPQPHGLSPREGEVARLVCLGKTDKEIARLLGMECSTVRTHLENIHHKLGTHRRGELAHRLQQTAVQQV